jgi:hypothetical protein
MADPLSAPGLAVGAVSLGFQVCELIYKYLDRLNARTEDIRHAREKVRVLENTLKCIDAVISRLASSFQDIVDGVHNNIKTCRQELQELNLLISNLTSDKNAKASEKKTGEGNKATTLPLQAR